MKKIGLVLLCGFIPAVMSCDKSYNCRCNIAYNGNPPSTGVENYPFNDLSRKKAEDACGELNGFFVDSDELTGLIISGTKECVLE